VRLNTILEAIPTLAFDDATTVKTLAPKVDVYVKVNYIPSAGGAGAGGPKSHQED
jgi:hypothetical protein